MHQYVPNERSIPATIKNATYGMILAFLAHSIAAWHPKCALDLLHREVVACRAIGYNQPKLPNQHHHHFYHPTGKRTAALATWLIYDHQSNLLIAHTIITMSTEMYKWKDNCLRKDTWSICRLDLNRISNADSLNLDQHIGYFFRQNSQIPRVFVDTEVRYRNL